MSDELRSALHEAAHAVVGLLNGVDIRQVTLDPPNCRAAAPAGWILLAEGGAFRPPRRSLGDNDRAAVSAHIAWLAAGAVVSAQFGELVEDDRELLHAAELVTTLDLADPSYEELYLERMHGQASTLLAEHWPAVQAVADKLREHRTLSGDQVRWVMRHSDRLRTPEKQLIWSGRVKRQIMA